MMKMPFGLHIGTEVTAPRHDGPSMTGRVVGRRTTGGRVWGVLVEFHDGLRDVVGVGFVRRVIPAPVRAAPTPPAHYTPTELAACQVFQDAPIKVVRQVGHALMGDCGSIGNI